MLENIHRHMEKGLAPIAAAHKGCKQIVFAIIGMTISLMVVYMPVALVKGHIAAIFREFAFTLAGAVMISGFVALTLSPMMCGHLLSKKSLTTGYTHSINMIFNRLSNAYQALLSKMLNKRLWVMLATLLLAISGIFIFQSLRTQFMPTEDMGYLVVSLNPPTGSSFDFLKKQTNTVNKALKTMPGIDNIVALITDNTAASGDSNFTFITLKKMSARDSSAKMLAETLTQQFKQIPGMNTFAFAPSPFSGSSRQDLEFSIMTTGSYEDLYHEITMLQKKFNQYPGMNNINSNMTFDSQQYDINVKRELAASLGVTIADIDNTIATFLGGITTTYFDLHDYRYDVILQAQEEYINNIKQLNKFYVPNMQDNLVPLASLITVKKILSEESLPHYNQLRSANMSAQVSAGYTLGEVVDYLNKTLPTLLSANTKFVFTGMAEKLRENSSSMATIFVLALICIYLVLAALFESFIDPLIVLLTVPLCIVGALAALKLTGGTLNVFTDIALITLVGLISKHGILITQFINELRTRDYALDRAIIQGAATRLRPVLMTTTAMIFGALPLLFTGGASANSRFQIGIVIISGLVSGTFFSLFVVPVTYYYLSRFKKIKIYKEN